jgi:hypothetical protein
MSDRPTQIQTYQLNISERARWSVSHGKRRRIVVLQTDSGKTIVAVKIGAIPVQWVPHITTFRNNSHTLKLNSEDMRLVKNRSP